MPKGLEKASNYSFSSLLDQPLAWSRDLATPNPVQSSNVVQSENKEAPEASLNIFYSLCLPEVIYCILCIF